LSATASNSASASIRASFRDALLPTHHEISGILYKWVNYGKGWRPRWFVLQDGVLSYYKIHGPDRIDVNPETEKGSIVIGEESLKRVNRAKGGDHGHGNNHGYGYSHGNGGSPVHARKAFGEVHLKVCSLVVPGSYDICSLISS
jgi:oxysterol-binding protein 1